LVLERDLGINISFVSNVFWSDEDFWSLYFLQE
jgi:hypothetical protein